MERYSNLFVNSFRGYASYLWQEILHPHWGNYFYWLIAISLAVFALELLFPWWKNQPALRQDFWLDGFYMFFNFFLFSLIGYSAESNVAAQAFNDFLTSVFGIRNLVAVNVASWPHWAQLLSLFLIRDFIQWNTHQLLHYVPWLWKFHKVHHSVTQMGFAAHLRYHFMENIVYRTIENLSLAMIGFGIQDFILVHLFAITVGHLNQANFYLPLDQAKSLRAANQSPMERMGEALVGKADEESYRAVELRVADPSRIKPVTEKITQLGFRAFSVTNQLEEIERIFLIINSSLALLGGIALLVASFGISNTMIMSIRERTREIGIMKAIGGSDGEIMRIFFVEASLIGLLGGTLGVSCGWLIDRVANALANQWIVRQTGQAVRYVQFFSIPWYLWTGAILFAVTISLLAAIYPARSAAKVDPIKALRHE